MAKDLAREIGYIYIDSGAMYRAVTLYSLQKGFFTERGIDTEALKTAMPDIHISFPIINIEYRYTYFITVESGTTTSHEFSE